MTAFKLFVFDLDGTLVDSRRDLADSVNVLLESCGAGPLAEAAVGAMVGDGARVLVARAFQAADQPPPPDALERFLSIYDTRLLVHTRAYPQVAEVLAELSGRAALALLTNKPLGATRTILDGLNLARYFDDDRVIGGDGPFQRKPDPSGLRHLMRVAGIAPTATLMIGDSIIDWSTARNGGTAICLARYGFGFASLTTTELAPSDRVIDALGDLLRL